jgi:hypothetical protein
MVSITSVLSRLHSLIKLTKLWDHIITKELKFYINKEGKEIFDKPWIIDMGVNENNIVMLILTWSLTLNC